MRETDQLAPMPVVLVDVREKNEKGFQSLIALVWGFVIEPLIIMAIFGHFHGQYSWIPPVGFGDSILIRVLSRVLFEPSVGVLTALKTVTRKDSK